METIKQRIQSKAKKVKRYVNRSEQFQQNKLFQNDQSRFYRNLEGASHENLCPDPKQATEFWSNLWSNPVEHHTGQWLDELKEETKGIENKLIYLLTLSPFKSKSTAQPAGKVLVQMGYTDFGTKL
jgi:hypothetical protein